MSRKWVTLHWSLPQLLLTGRNSGGAICVGGPALVRYLQPTDEELFQKYNPELQKRSLERRVERQQEFDDFVTKLKEYSKSDKPSKCHSRWLCLSDQQTNTTKYGLYRLRPRRRKLSKTQLPRQLRWPRRSRQGKKP